MGWPLILSLAGSAAQGMSDDYTQIQLRKRAEEAALKKQQALNRALEDQARSKEQQAMAAYLKGNYPVSIGKTSFAPERTEDPNLGLAALLGGMGGLATQLGQYYEPRVNQDQYQYSGAKTPSVSSQEEADLAELADLLSRIK